MTFAHQIRISSATTSLRNSWDLRASAGILLLLCQIKTSDNQKQLPLWPALLSDCFLIFLIHFSFSLLNLCGFDEPTPLGVSMTESRTRCAIRGKVSLVPAWPRISWIRILQR